MCQGCTSSFYIMCEIDFFFLPLVCLAHHTPVMKILPSSIKPHQEREVQGTSFPPKQGQRVGGEYHGWHHIKTMQRWTSEAASELQDCIEDTRWHFFDYSDIEHNTSAVFPYITFCAVTVTVKENIKVSPNLKP